MRSSNPRFILIILFQILVTFSFAQSRKNSSNSLGGISAIKEGELKTDLYEMAGDHFRGREAGTLDELKVSVWFADKLKAVGLKPMGDDGTYYQFFTMYRNRLSPQSIIKIGDRNFTLWQDILVARTAPAMVSAPVVFVGNGMKDDLDKVDLKNKAVAVMVSQAGINLNVSLPERRYFSYVFAKYNDILKRGASAVIFIADSYGEKSWSQVLPGLVRGTYDVAGGSNIDITAKPPVMWVHGSDAEFLKQSGLTLTANLNIEHFEYPSVNIIGKIDGTDPLLKKEYVLFSGHQDHDGVRQLYGTDSIYNGADDNATTSVAILAIARAFNQKPGKRSALFVWHGAEERGLLGSRYYSAHPTVDKNGIVAVLNADMIGRNNPDSAALLGVQAPHKNSSDLVAMALAANNEGPKFKLDTTWDKATHVEGWYFRSDHLPYARAGVPSVFFTTLLHSEYHTPMDEAKNIDYKKLTRMTQWMFRTGWKVANTSQRPKLEAGFKLER